jgi:hypothetical protein
MDHHCQKIVGGIRSEFPSRAAALIRPVIARVRGCRYFADPAAHRLGRMRKSRPRFHAGVFPQGKCDRMMRDSGIGRLDAFDPKFDVCGSGLFDLVQTRGQSGAGGFDGTQLKLDALCRLSLLLDMTKKINEGFAGFRKKCQEEILIIQRRHYLGCGLFFQD